MQSHGTRDLARGVVHGRGIGMPGMDGSTSKAGLWAAAVVLLMVLLGGSIAAMWSAGVFSPADARGGAGPRAKPHEAVAAILDSAKRLMAREEAGKAEAILESGVRQYPEFPELRLAYVETLVWQNRLDEAYAHQVEAIERGASDAIVEFTAGSLASRLNRPEEAAVHYEAAQKKDPVNPDYPLYLAQVQIKLHRADEAKANLILAAQLAPDNAIPWGTLADVLLRENKADMALQQIAKARRLQPTAPSWKIIEARALLRKAEPDKALLILDTLDDADRHAKPVLATIAQCHGLLGQPAAAAALYAEVSHTNPGDGDLAFEAALWFDRAGDRTEAMTFAERALRARHAGAEKLLERLRTGG